MGNQVFGVDRVGVRVKTTKIFQWHSIHDRSGRRAQFALNDGLGVGPAHRIHGINANSQTVRKHPAQHAEIKKRPHHRGVIGHRVDHLNLHLFNLLHAQGVDGNVWRVAKAQFDQLLGAGINSFSQCLIGRTAVTGVVLDAEVAVWSARVMAG